jgi:hypothetical protein
MTHSKRCPECGSSKVADILYGMPTPRAMKQATTGKVVLGGCAISMNSPQFHCHHCENRWSDELLLDGDMSI